MKFSVGFLSLAFLVAPLATSCSRSDHRAPTNSTDAAKTNPLRGVIVEVQTAPSALLVKHEDIPGLMPAMTMLFKVDAATLKAAAKDQAITATLFQQGGDFWLRDVKPAAAAAGTSGKAAAGQLVYMRVCFACHQPTGLGLPPAFPPLAGSAIATEANPGKIIRIVLHGLQGPIEVKGTTYTSLMPAQGAQLNDREIADALTYVRNTWGNTAAPVTVEAVAEVRAQVQRPTPWTWAELNPP
jgi:mono/diheme cytochrome c family protein